MIVVGLGSGTSVDGIDVAAADLALDGGVLSLAPLGHLVVPYSRDLRRAIIDALPPAATTLAQVCRIDTGVGREFAAAAVRAVAELCDGGADLIASHGQTLYHWAERGRARGTFQVGQPAWIAEATGVAVVSDLRAADVAAGGNGAPLASTLDVLLLGERAGPSAALNLGGIANVTITAAGRAAIAFDTGPGNVLIDAAAALVSGGREDHDHDGRRAARGTIDRRLLEVLLDEPYYGWDPPKSTGRETFHRGYLERALIRAPVAGDDLLATVTALTAHTVADACHRCGVAEVLVSGGGAHNPVLLGALRERLAPARVTTTAAIGIPVDAKEAYLFAVLAFLTWHGLPATVPACTGARRATPAGRITPGATPLVLPPPAPGPPTRLRVAA